MSIRYRSGSVERRVTSSNVRDPAPYRTSYGTERGRTRDLPPSGTRMSRATSYDPFATSPRSNSVIRTTGLSSSDYSPRNSHSTSLSYTSRYGSTEQLNSPSSYRPSYRSGSMTSSSTSSGGGATSSAGYTPRNVRAGSVSIGAYDPPSRSIHSEAFSSSSLSRYRPPDTTPSYTSNLSRYRSTDLSSTSDYSSSKYSSPRYSAYSSRTSTNSSFRSDRDYRSMSRGNEAAEEETEDEVENTFRKLYKKYVTAESVPDLTKSDKSEEEESLAKKVTRRFESKSEAEDSDFSISEEDEDEILSKYQKRRRASSTSSITPRASVCNSPSKDVTPKCSPLPARKEFHPKSRSNSPEIGNNVKPLTRNFQMEATFGVVKTSGDVKLKDSEDVQKIPEVVKMDSENVKSFKKTPEVSDDVKTSEDIQEDVKTDVKDSEDFQLRQKSPEDVQKNSEPSKCRTEDSDDVNLLQNTPEAIKIDVKPSKDDQHLRKSPEDLLMTSEPSKFEFEDSDDVNLLQNTPEAIKIVVKPSKDLPLRQKSPEHSPTSEVVENYQKPPEDVKFPSEIVKKVAASIKINGIPVKEKSEIQKEEGTSEIVGLVEKIPVRIRIRSDKSPVREVPSENPISSAAEVVLHSEPGNEGREKSSESEDNTTSSSRASSIRKRRDPNRTLENLQTILRDQKMEKNEENSGSEEKKIRRIPIPLVLITEPSNPSTPMATTPVTTAASICLWNQRTSSTSSEGDYDEDEQEYEDEEDEYSSGDWTEGEDDEEYLTDEEDEDAEFSVSQTFSLKDHIDLKELYPLTNSPSGASALVSEFCGSSDFNPEAIAARKEESRGRVDSLFAIPAPTFTASVTYDGQADDDVDEWSDEVHSCEEGDDDDFRVLPIIRPGSSSLGAYLSPGSISSEDSENSEEDSEDYDGTTVGCTLKLVDRAARKDSEDETDSEYYDDEEELDDEDEEYWDEEIEYEDEEEEELEYYEDEEMEEEEEVEEVEELFVAPPIRLMTESLVEEMIEEACYGEIPEETLFALDGVEVEEYMGHKDVQMIPTFVRQMTEDIREESTSRFAVDRKPATDFAKKAVIQPTKLEKVQIGSKIDTKLAPSEEEKRKKKMEEEMEKKRKEEVERKRKETEEMAKKQQEDKSALRKSALNMKDEDAKKKAANDEKAAAQKARRFGTVSAMAGKFDEKEEEIQVPTKKNEAVTYKKSSRLEHVEKPKRTYEVIKPVINDDFDKQMEEIRKQMKSGSNELQNKMKILSKGILTVTEEAKSREMEEKRRVTVEKATGAIGKAEQEKARWKATRDAETAAEYAKIEAEKHLKKKRILIDKPSGETVLNQEKVEPKRTVRRWKPPPPDPNAVIPSFSCGPKEPAKPKIIPENAPKPSSKPSTPTSRRKVMTSSPTVPKAEGAAATRIRNNAEKEKESTVIPAGPDTKKETQTGQRKYNARRKTQEIVNESAVKPKTKQRKEKARKRKFTRQDRDADSMLGFQNYSTFEQLERFFEAASRNRRPVQKLEKIRRLAPSKMFISDLTDIDKIYKSSEIRDIIASVNLIY